MKGQRWGGVFFWSYGGLLALMALAYGVGGYRWNGTASLPKGLYQQTDQPFQRGDLVLACPQGPLHQLPQQRDYSDVGVACPHWQKSILKRVVALPGDLVKVSEQGIQVNGQSLPHTARFSVDGLGQPLPALPPAGIVPEDQVWLVANHHPRSYDSRYFGAVAISAIQGTAIPIWIKH